MLTSSVLVEWVVVWIVGDVVDERPVKFISV